VIVSRIDPNAMSTHAAAKGFRALCEGDTVLARVKYGEAGHILEAGAAQTQSAPEKNLLRFLAASQYYHGGDYQRALRVVRRTKPKYLSESDREKFEAFRKDVEERADAGYVARIAGAVRAAWQERRIDDAIKLLQRHPYIVERAELAWQRAVLCSVSGRLKAAALFSADAVRFSGSHPAVLILRAGMPLASQETRSEADAVELARLLLEHSPTPLDWLTASVVLFPNVRDGDLAAGVELLRRFERARAEFPGLSAATAHDQDIRSWMCHGFFVAVLTADRLNGREAALALLTEAETFGPSGNYADIFRTLRADNGEWFKSPEVQKLANEGPVRLRGQVNGRYDAPFATAA
jgi:hypothetical protein